MKLMNVFQQNKSTVLALEGAALIGVSCGVGAMFHETANAMFYSGMFTGVGASFGALSASLADNVLVKSARNMALGAMIGLGISQAFIATHPHEDQFFSKNKTITLTR